VVITDLYLNILFDGGELGNAGVRPNSIVADINSDGSNEFCYTFTAGSLRCYDGSFSLKQTLSLPTGAFPTKSRASAGAYYNNILDILTGTSIYSRNVMNGTLFKSGSLPSTNLYAIPVVIDDRTNFVKDILSVSISTQVFLFSDQLASTCGNGICDSGENFLSCPVDCVLTSPTQAVLTEISINPCNTVIWIKNTTVQVMAKAESSDNADVNISAVIYGGTSAEQRANSGFVSSGTSTTFNFIANTSCSGCSIGVSAYTMDNPVIDSHAFSFSVNDVSGVSFGSSSCGIVQPLEIVIANSNITGKTDNAVSNSVNLFAGLTGLSILIIYLFIMFFVGIACFIFGLYMKMESKFVFLIVLFLEVLMTIIGSLPPLNIIPVGVIIVLVLTMVIIIAVWLRGIFTGSSDGNGGV
jgi:hypothetical protein